MTNGQLTKKILKAAKTLEGAALAEEVKDLMRCWPMSSHSLVYDSDSKKVKPENWKAIIAAAIETDKEKLERMNVDLSYIGMDPKKELGRYTAKRK